MAPSATGRSAAIRWYRGIIGAERHRRQWPPCTRGNEGDSGIAASSYRITLMAEGQ